LRGQPPNAQPAIVTGPAIGSLVASRCLRPVSVKRQAAPRDRKEEWNHRDGPGCCVSGRVTSPAWVCSRSEVNTDVLAECGHIATGGTVRSLNELSCHAAEMLPTRERCLVAGTFRGHPCLDPGYTSGGIVRCPAAPGPNRMRRRGSLPSFCRGTETCAGRRMQSSSVSRVGRLRPSPAAFPCVKT